MEHTKHDFVQKNCRITANEQFSGYSIWKKTSAQEQNRLFLTWFL